MSLKKMHNITWQEVAAGTENFVDTLFEGDNVEKIFRDMIHQAHKEKEIGWLPSSRLDEDDINDGTPEAISKIVARYRGRVSEFDKKSKQTNQPIKEIYITNLAVSKNNGQNHYCAFWINKKKRFVRIWDSASSGLYGSSFSVLFRKSAELLFTKNKSGGLGWADNICKVSSTSDGSSFQYGGGFFGKYRSILAQNVYCHTWTLFFLELRLLGSTAAKIGCIRGSHYLIPLMLIKLYSQCLLRRMSKQMSDKYKGLLYIWDDKKQEVFVLPKLQKGTPGVSCAQRAVDTAKSQSSIFHKTHQCKNII